MSSISQNYNQASTNWLSLSPSPYVAFNTLWAENRCSAFGPVVSRTTLAVNPTGISRWWVEPTNIVTADAFVRSELLDFRQFQGCTQTPGGKLPETITRDDGTVVVVWVADGCNPIIKIPVEVTNALPEWRTCGVWYSGIYDPPVVLTSGSNLHPPTTPPIPEPTPDPTTSKPVAEPVKTPTKRSSTPPQPATTPPPTQNQSTSKGRDNHENTPPANQQSSSSRGKGANNSPLPQSTSRSSVFDIGGTKVTLRPAPSPSTTQKQPDSNEQNGPGAGQVLPIGSITLSAGGATQISGISVSLGDDVLVIGTQTHSLDPPLPTVQPSLGIGDIILSAMGIDVSSYQYVASETGQGGIVASYPTGENGSRPTGVDVVPFSGDAPSTRMSLTTRLLYLLLTVSFWWLI